ncbi:MAG: MotA/TolQ/ExbB proton channel family protein [bacterium]|nr:MotA/TolQ/ExbB proton channel family protein [bacterium]
MRYLTMAAAAAAALVLTATGAAADSWFSVRYAGLVRGGVLMIPLAICSILTAGFIIERFVAVRPSRVVPLDFVLKVRGLVSEGKFDEARALCRRRSNPVATVFNVALMLNDRPSVSDEVIRSTVQDLATREVDDIALRTRPLLILSNITPLLGLLGTVFGIIKAFNVVASEAGLGRADLLAAGISEALITTATGLAIAIPALAFYNYFRGILDGRISERMEITMRAFLEDLFEGRDER